MTKNTQQTILFFSAYLILMGLWFLIGYSIGFNSKGDISVSDTATYETRLNDETTIKVTFDIIDKLLKEKFN